MRPAALVLALAAAGCAYGPPPGSDCVSTNAAAAAAAMPRIRALSDPPPTTLEAGFVLCSPHEHRLLAASAALGAQGYSSYIGTAKRGKCLRVPRTHEASAEALEREVTAMCGVAAAHGIAYRRWQTEVAGKSARIAAGRLTVGGE